MNRQTSVDCYNDIVLSGLLSKIRLKVTRGVVDMAPCTSTELERHMNNKYGMKGTWKVLSWLREAGVVYEVGTRDCSITGRNVIEWDLTGKLPVPPIKKTTKPKNIGKSIDYILQGMKIRGWETIDIKTLNKLKK